VHYVRQDEFAYLASVAGSLASASMADKRSNERYFLHLTSGLPTPLRVDTAANGSALATFSATFGTGSFRTHFPYNTLLAWAGGGSMAVAGDGVAVGASSELSSFASVAVSYSRNCDGCAASVPNVLARHRAGGRPAELHA
jgi:hypothetical protein